MIEGVAENIPLKDNLIDLIISNNGINNVANLQQTLNECGRVAKKGAQFVITVNMQETMIEFYDIYKRVLFENKLGEYVDQVDEQIYKKRKPLGELKERLAKSDFSISSIEEDTFYYEFVDGEAIFRHFLISLAFLDSWKNIIPVEKQEYVFNLVKQQVDLLAQQNGTFTLSVPYVTIDCVKR